jgi:hypothetical protein
LLGEIGEVEEEEESRITLKCILKYEEYLSPIVAQSV